MAIKDIVIYLTPGQDNTHVYDSLAILAEDSKCHVTGVYAIPPVPTLAGDAAIPITILKDLEESAERIADEHRSAFESEMESRGIAAEWIAQHGDPDDIVASKIRYADIGVMRQPNDPEPSNYSHTLNHVLLNSGRPILVIPYIGTKKSIGKRVIVGWNSSVESTRAVHDAIPLMIDADWVEVVGVDDQVSSDTLGSSTPISEHLARHKINAEAKTFSQSEVEPGDVLINQASDRDADLIVAGAWGHTRAREYIFGGSTRTLLQHMTVPVLFSH